MAAIDKTYLDSWEQYQQLKDWCSSIGTTMDDYGNKIRPIDFLWNYWKPEDFKKGHGVPVWNTPEYFDVWLIRNCPLDFIQDNLKEQYDDNGWSKTSLTGRQEQSAYELIKEHKSAYDLYKRNGLGEDAVISVDWKYNNNFNDDKLWWWINIKGAQPEDMWWYNGTSDSWVNTGQGELKPWTSNVCHRWGKFNIHKVLRMIRKWNLPEGTKVHFDLMYKRYTQKEFIVTVRKQKSRNIQRAINKLKKK